MSTLSALQNEAMKLEALLSSCDEAHHDELMSMINELYFEMEYLESEQEATVFS